MSVAALQAYVDRERSVNGLLDISFTPGSDREVSQDEAAAVALAMLSYTPETSTPDSVCG